MVNLRPLTARQREVLDLLVLGMSSKEIGAALGVDDRTVDYHVGQMCSKVGLWSRRELVVFAVRSEAQAA
ncbi:MAG: helix-turn-helix transcriptional regulator [Acidobacteriia bacterium]|nr:helix-turn-helix transcriptional regulator [Terriglobia bacterium]